VVCLHLAADDSAVRKLDAADGFLVWKKELADFYGNTEITAVDMDGDGDDEIVVSAKYHTLGYSQSRRHGSYPIRPDRAPRRGDRRDRGESENL